MQISTIAQVLEHEECKDLFYGVTCDCGITKVIECQACGKVVAMVAINPSGCKHIAEVIENGSFL